MDLHEKIKNRTDEARQIIDAEIKEVNISEVVAGMEQLFGLPVQSKKKVSEYLDSALGWVYACTDAIAQEIGNIELKLIEQRNGRDPVEIDNDPILDVLHRANNNTTKFDLFYLTQLYLDLTGEAPWFIQFQNGTPVGIFLLRPDRLEVIPPSKPDEIIGGYKYKVYENGKEKTIDLEPFEVVFLKYPDTKSPFRGRGTLSAMTTTYDIDQTAEQYNLKFFGNSATPNGILTTDKKLGKEQMAYLKRELLNKYTGFENAHKTLVLEQGLDFKHMALSQREMDFINGQKFTRDKILAMFRVPKAVLGIVEDVNRANAEASDFVFAKRTIKPKMQKLTEMLNEFFVPLFDDTGTLYLDYEDPVPENIELKIRQAESGVTRGYMTVNEARMIVGLDPIDGGDEIRTPVTPAIQQSPIAEGITPIKKIVPSRTNKRSMHVRGKKDRMRKEVIRQIRQQVEDNVTAVIADQLKKKKNGKDKRVQKKVKNDHVKRTGIFDDNEKVAKKQKQAFQDKLLRAGEEYEERYRKRLRGVFESEKTRVIAKFDQRAFNPDDFLFDDDAEGEFIAGKIATIEQEVVIKQGNIAFQLLGKEDKLTTRIPLVKEFLQKRVFDFSIQITQETNKKLKSLLQDSIDKGDGILVIKTKIKQLFDDMKSYRAERIARSEIMRATNFATELAYIQSGVVEAKEWHTNIDHVTDAECIAMNGKIIGLGKSFFNKGETFGNLKLDYETILYPPLHVNCRCTLLPVVLPII